MVFIQLTKEQAKEAVKKLVDKYNRVAEAGNIKRYKEEDTKAEFIEPLFEALGWDVRNVENDEEVIREEKISKGRVDYSFRISGIPKFFLEAKALKEDLDNIKFIEQAINYSWHKGCVWAVLTDFESVKVFNAEWKSSNPLQNMLFSINCSQFLDMFEQLWLLSRGSFESGLIDKEAEKWGKKAKKIPVDKQLLSDLTRFRELLSKNIMKNNLSKNLTSDDLDESVQRIIDRLIFIRTLEDKQLEAPMLQSLIREDANKKVYKKLNDLFRKIDDIYNSKLFIKHLCEDLVIDDDVLEKIIIGLFQTSDNAVHYDFGAIDADVLGNIYEQYLGHILNKTDKRAKLAEGKTHRKEQGIYYTPTYVVDYIVKNTIGELAKDKKFDLSKIKILDPACGSGSFLMKAFDYLVTLDKKKNGDADQMKLDLTGVTATYGKKVDILKNNIFGVDLDPKAVEIAQLNLLLKAAEKKHRLPTLQENIKVGNSLIDDPAVAGNRAFKWEEQFKDVIADGGFNVVIGNPPYFNIRTNLELQNFVKNRFPEIYHGQNDVIYYFVMKGLSLLDEVGYLGFIISRYFMESDSAKKFREFILDKAEIIRIIDFGNNQVFDGANVLTLILILRKNTKQKNNSISIIKFKDDVNPKLLNSGLERNPKENIISLTIKQKSLDSDIWTFYDSTTGNIIKKIEHDSFNLGKIAKTGAGIQSGLNSVYVVSDEVISKYKLEKTLLRNYVKTMDLKPYLIINRGLKVIRITNSENIDNFPLIKKYLEENQKELKNRYEAKKGICKWYAFAVPRNLDIFDSKREKIITPIYSTSNKFGYDSGKDGENYLTLSDTAVIQVNDPAYSTKSILAILNSKLMNFYYKKTRKLKREGYFEYLSKTVEPLPIKYSNSFSKSVERLVDNILVLKNKLLAFKDKQTDEKVRLENEIQKLDDEIDQEVYKLYGLTKEEIKIIENSLK